MHDVATRKPLSCSFCNKTRFDVARLVAGPGVYICNECVALCNEIIASERERARSREGASGRARRRQAAASHEPPSIKAWEGLSDTDLLGEMARAHAAHENVDRAVAHHVSALRARGVTWARIGEALGMARQSAWERFSGEE